MDLSNWIYFENSEAGLNMTNQSSFGIDKNDMLWFTDVGGQTIKIINKEDINWFFKNILRLPSKTITEA